MLSPEHLKIYKREIFLLRCQYNISNLTETFLYHLSEAPLVVFNHLCFTHLLRYCVHPQCSLTEVV